MNLVNGHNHNDPVVDKFRDSGIVLGDYTHVFVDPVNKRPTPFSKDWIPKLENLLLKWYLIVLVFSYHAFKYFYII